MRSTVFRDLKPDNVVIDAAGHAMLTDFGLSKEGVLGQRGTKSFCGSVAFLAPEILLRRGHGHTVDIYNLGVLLFDMLTGLPPFYHPDRETLFANIKHARLVVPQYVPRTARSLIEALMEREPSRRPLGPPRAGPQACAPRPNLVPSVCRVAVRASTRARARRVSVCGAERSTDAPRERLGAASTADVQKHAYFADTDFRGLMRREALASRRPGDGLACDAWLAQTLLLRWRSVAVYLKACPVSDQTISRCGREYEGFASHRVVLTVKAGRAGMRELHG